MDRTYCIQFKQGVDSRKRVVTSKTLEKEHIGMITATSRKYRDAANRRCFAKVGFLKISQNPLEETCVRVSF